MSEKAPGRTNYSGLATLSDKGAKHVGGNIRPGDPFTFTPTAWRYLAERFAVGSVLDLGSGRGHAGLFFHRLGLRVLCVDGLASNVENAVHPTVLHDLTQGPVRTRVDLAHSQELVEHIEERFVANVVDSLLCGEIIVFTHALPGQGGYHHVNLQPPEYWIGQMQARGCVLLEEDTARIRRLAVQDGGVYLAATGLVFENPAARR
jgi:hypothetical protein